MHHSMELAGFAPNAQTDFLLLTAGQPDSRPGVSLAAILTSRVPGKDAFSRAYECVTSWQGTFTSQVT